MKFGNLASIRSVIWLFSAILLYLLLWQMIHFLLYVLFACRLYHCWLFHIRSLSNILWYQAYRNIREKWTMPLAN